jgi:hypothetical protein
LEITGSKAEAPHLMEVMMIRQPVTSEALASAGYDSAHQIFEVEFHNGRIYRYFDFPDEAYEQFISASSKGTFFNTQIKKRYAFEIA